MRGWAALTAELTSMVHIISRPYMLRDYFAYHLNGFVRNEKGMQMFVPTYYADLKAPSIALLIRLRENGMTIEEIVAYMNLFGANEDNAERALTLALETVFGKSQFVQIYSYFSFGKEEIRFYNGAFHHTRMVKLTNEAIYKKVCAMTENNIVVTNAHSEVLPIDRASVYNRFLPGQRFSFSGSRYEILSISNGTLSVREEESVEREKEYTQIYDYPAFTLASEPERSWKNNEHYSRDLFSATVTRKISGYFSHINGMDFSENNTMRFKLDHEIVETRTVKCLRLRFFFPFGEEYDAAAALLVVLFRGVLQTALPKNYPDILVASHLGERAFREDLFDQTPDGALRKDPLPSDWLETGDYDLPLTRWLKMLFPAFESGNVPENDPQQISLYLVDFSQSGNHILSAVAEETTRLLNVLYGYLEWVIQNPDLKHVYLKFGYNQVPEIFNLPVVHAFLQRVADYAPEVSGDLHGKLVVPSQSEKHYCSFCGRPISVSRWTFEEDDRIMCEDCYKHRTTERKEIQVLLRRAYDTLENKYQITLPPGIKIRFKSASSIAKAGGTVHGGRILGFYSFAKKEVWVERGGPEPCVLATLMHELTHAWQHANLPDMDKLALKYIEGHATYVEIECTRLLGQKMYADFWERNVEAGNDVYAEGLLYWKERLKQESDKNIFKHIKEM